MANLQDIIRLASVDGGKFFVMDESGEVKLVILKTEDYEKLLLGKIHRQLEDVERINKEIMHAQLQETPVAPPVPAPKIVTVEKPPRVDLREEVLDPSFDFEGPKMDFDDL